MTPPRAAKDDDAALMLRVQADDPGAFGALYDRFSSRAYGAAYALSGNRSRTEDIVQDAFLTVWRSRGRFRPDHGSAAAWVMSIVRNRALDSLRWHGRHDRHRVNEERLDERVQAPDNVEDITSERHEAARLRAALARLPPAQREVITLAYFGELTGAEIAKELSLPLGTVKGRMRLGLHKLAAPDGMDRQQQHP